MTFSMDKTAETIIEVDLTKTDTTTFKHQFVGCIIKTYDDKFLLQQIVDHRPFFPAGSLVTFGCRIENNESPIQALIRELNEELGAKVNTTDAIYLGSITEAATNHTELIYTYFWHNKANTITGCYEDKAKYFGNIEEIYANSKVTDDILWMLNKYKFLTQ